METQLHTPQKGGRAPSPIFGPCLLFPNANDWFEMPLGIDVGLGAGDIVLDEDKAPPPGKNGSNAAPTFRPMSVVGPNGWMD